MKKQSKLMTFLMSLLLAFMLAVPGNAVSTQAAGQGDMAVHFIDVARDWQSSSSQEEKIFFMMVEIGHMRMKWYSI